MFDKFPDHIVTAASLSRILEHFTTDDRNVGVAILTVDRGDRAFTLNDAGEAVTDNPENAQLNNKLHKKLESILKGFGLKGWIKTKGGVLEEGMKKTTYERSYFVPGVDKNTARKLAQILGENHQINKITPRKRLANRKALQEDFRQDSILWGSNAAGAFIVNANGKFESLGSEFEPNTLSKYFTEWRKRRFTFREAKSMVRAWIEYLPPNPHPSDVRQLLNEISLLCYREGVPRR